MTDPTIPQRVLFPELLGKPVVAAFDREQASSDGGAVLLKVAERVYGLVQASLAASSTGVRRRGSGTRWRI